MILVMFYAFSRKNTRAKARLFYLLIAVCLIISIIVGGSVGLWIGLDNKSSTKLLYESVRVENAMDTLQVCDALWCTFSDCLHSYCKRSPISTILPGGWGSNVILMPKLSSYCSRSILTGYNKSAGW